MQPARGSASHMTNPQMQTDFADVPRHRLEDVRGDRNRFGSIFRKGDPAVRGDAGSFRNLFGSVMEDQVAGVAYLAQLRKQRLQIFPCGRADDSDASQSAQRSSQ